MKINLHINSSTEDPIKIKLPALPRIGETIALKNPITKKMNHFIVTNVVHIISSVPIVFVDLTN